MASRTRRIIRSLLIALVLLIAALAAFVAWGPVPVSNKRVLVDFLLGRGIAPPDADVIASRLSVPEGFRVQAYSTDVPLARFMVVTPTGDLIVTRTRAGAVTLLAADRDGDGDADAARTLIDGLDGPHGIALSDGWLYLAERTRIVRAPFDVQAGELRGPLETVLEGLTTNGFHQTKTIGFGPDGWLYLAQGSTCNVCIEEDSRRATIMRMRPDGTDAAVIATGLRNSVGFDWAHWDGALYATENGRDLLGDDLPPDELNRIENGAFYGWPYFHGDGIPDPEFGTSDAGAATAVPPVHGFRAHNAPLGIHFLRPATLPAGYERTALVALHGSWNRTTPDGYKVVALRWLDDGRIVESDFLDGFLSPDGVIGRPAGVTQGPDGAIYVSDDYAGVIYRVTAQPTARSDDQSDRQPVASSNAAAGRNPNGPTSPSQD